MVRSLARCRSCGLPGILAEYADWRPNGTIMLRRLKGIRMVMLDAATLKGLYDEITVDKGIEALYLEEKGATRYIVGKLFPDVLGKISRYDMVKNKVMEVMEDLSLLFGTGRIEVERYIPSQMMVLILKKPLNLHLVTAGIAGVIEEIDKCQYAYSHSELGEDVFRLTLEAINGGVYDKGSFEWLIPGSPLDKHIGTLDRCRQCGLPLTAGGFRWDELRGVIEAGEEWRRVGLLPMYTLEIVTKMAGEWNAKKNGEFLEEVVYSATLKQLQAGMADAYSGMDTVSSLSTNGPSNDIWNVLQIRGWGVTEEVRVDARQWHITIINPFDTALLAGWLRAIYTIAVGREPRLSKTQEAARLHCVMK